MTEQQRPDDLRERAIRSLKKRRDLYGHVLAYVLVNAFLVMVWASTSPEAFFWPVFPIVGWGIGVVMNAWDVFFANPELDEDKVQREMEHLQHRH